MPRWLLCVAAAACAPVELATVSPRPGDANVLPDAMPTFELSRRANLDDAVVAWMVWGTDLHEFANQVPLELLPAHRHWSMNHRVPARLERIDGRTVAVRPLGPVPAGRMQHVRITGLGGDPIEVQFRTRRNPLVLAWRTTSYEEVVLATHCEVDEALRFERCIEGRANVVPDQAPNPAAISPSDERRYTYDSEAIVGIEINALDAAGNPTDPRIEKRVYGPREIMVERTIENESGRIESSTVQQVNPRGFVVDTAEYWGAPLKSALRFGERREVAPEGHDALREFRNSDGIEFVVEYEVDELGRLQRSVTFRNGSPVGEVESFEYDNDGRLAARFYGYTTEQDPEEGSMERLQHDADGFLARRQFFVEPGDDGTPAWTITYTHDDDGQLLRTEGTAGEDSPLNVAVYLP